METSVQMSRSGEALAMSSREEEEEEEEEEEGEKGEEGGDEEEEGEETIKVDGNGDEEEETKTDHSTEMDCRQFKGQKLIRSGDVQLPILPKYCIIWILKVPEQF